jgi:hypothetical protein
LVCCQNPATGNTCWSVLNYISPFSGGLPSGPRGEGARRRPRPALDFRRGDGGRSVYFRCHHRDGPGRT